MGKPSRSRGEGVAGVAGREQAVGTSARLSAARGLRVLLLEDRPEDAELILHYLRQAGFEPEARRVDREQDSRAALSPEVDIVLADFALPDLDGLRALDLVAQTGLAIPFILVSGSVGEERAVEVMRRGAADYILKDRMARLGASVARAGQETEGHTQRVAEMTIRLARAIGVRDEEGSISGGGLSSMTSERWGSPIRSC